jgi:hypothetical protein
LVSPAGMEEGAEGGHQEVQGAAPPVPAGSPGPHDAANALIRRSIDRTPTTLFACLLLLYKKH